MTAKHAQQTVGILIFDDVEVLDFCGPFEVFSVAQPQNEDADTQRYFRVVTIAETDAMISCRGGLLVQPHFTIDTHPALDILVIPGGAGTQRVLKHQRVLHWIFQQHQHTAFTTSVCTGAFLLAELGLLNQRRATTHWASLERLQERYPAITVLSNERVVDEGGLITSAGVSAGIDMSLYVVEKLHGREAAAWTARIMEYEGQAQRAEGASTHHFPERFFVNE